MEDWETLDSGEDSGDQRRPRRNNNNQHVDCDQLLGNLQELIALLKLNAQQNGRATGVQESVSPVQSLVPPVRAQRQPASELRQQQSTSSPSTSTGEPTASREVSSIEAIKCPEDIARMHNENLRFLLSCYELPWQDIADDRDQLVDRVLSLWCQMQPETTTPQPVVEQRPLPSTSATSRSQQKRNEKLCVACWDKEKNVLFMPCKHVNTCKTCSPKMTHCK